MIDRCKNKVNNYTNQNVFKLELDSFFVREVERLKLRRKKKGTCVLV